MSPAVSLPLLKIRWEVWTEEMVYKEAGGAAETRANRWARIKNADARVNLVMLVKRLGRHREGSEGYKAAANDFKWIKLTE